MTLPLILALWLYFGENVQFKYIDIVGMGQDRPLYINIRSISIKLRKIFSMLAKKILFDMFLDKGQEKNT